MTDDGKAGAMAFKPKAFQFFGFGLEWEITRNQQSVAQEVVNYLQDARILLNPRALEDPSHCIVSALRARDFLAVQINKAKPGKALYRNLQGMQAAFCRFVDAGGVNGENFEQFFDLQYRRLAHRYTVLKKINRREPPDSLGLALGELRASIGGHLAVIVERYDIEMSDTLAAILPPQIEDYDITLNPFRRLSYGDKAVDGSRSRILDWAKLRRRQ
jgi:hypothetical protein